MHLFHIVLIVGLAPASAAMGDTISPIPFVKHWTPGAGHLSVERVSISSSGETLASEIDLLGKGLGQRRIVIGASGASIRLELAAVEFPAISSDYADRIRDQGYRIRIVKGGVIIEGRTPAGVFYGVQTLLQLINDEKELPCGEAIDWPDLAYRGVMVDPARANENARYYERLIRFCSGYKINRIHVHLTDDQNVCLHHDDYGPLLHPHAWRTEQLEPLVQLAKRLHIELIPEIESLGHARVFLRHPEFREFLHQTAKNKPSGSWTGTAEPGYTNVLCPASSRADRYLADMYQRTAEIFPYDELHVGCDEVDMTTCARCEARFPGISRSEWFLGHVLRCRELVADCDRRTAIWGDMLLKNRGIVDRIPREGTVIYDWHYEPDVSAESVVFFRQSGFEVVACPALMCYPYMILPSERSHTNIRRFAEIARTHDAVGLDTTIWIPTRYMSDVLWPGIAYAAVHAWSGADWDEKAFYRSFAREHFGLSQGEEFAEAWRALGRIDWPLQQFRTSCWFDNETLAKARQEAGGAAGAAAVRHLSSLENIRGRFDLLRADVKRNCGDWDTIERSADILAYTLRHFLAAAELQRDGRLDEVLLGELDRGCVQAAEWIEADWDRNRFADDPYKADLNNTGQHLLHRFRQMHAYHEQLLSKKTE